MGLLRDCEFFADLRTALVLTDCGLPGHWRLLCGGYRSEEEQGRMRYSLTL